MLDTAVVWYRGLSKHGFARFVYSSKTRSRNILLTFHNSLSTTPTILANHGLVGISLWPDGYDYGHGVNVIQCHVILLAA